MSDDDNDNDKVVPTIRTLVTKSQAKEPNLELLTSPTLDEEMQIDAAIDPEAYIGNACKVPAVVIPEAAEALLDAVRDLHAKNQALSTNDWAYLIYLLRHDLVEACPDALEKEEDENVDINSWSIQISSSQAYDDVLRATHSDSKPYNYVFTFRERFAIVSMMEKHETDGLFLGQETTWARNIGDFVMRHLTKERQFKQCFPYGCKLLVPIELKESTMHLSEALSLLSTDTPFNMSRSRFGSVFGDDIVTCKWITKNSKLLFGKTADDNEEEDQIWILPSVYNNEAIGGRMVRRFLFEVSLSLDSRNTSVFLSKVPKKLQGGVSVFPMNEDDTGEEDIKLFKIPMRSHVQRIEQFSKSCPMNQALETMFNVLDDPRNSPLSIFYDCMARTPEIVQYYSPVCPPNTVFTSHLSVADSIPSFVTVIVTDDDARKELLVNFCKRRLDETKGDKKRILVITGIKTDWGNEWLEALKKLDPKHVSIVSKSKESKVTAAHEEDRMIVIAAVDVRSFFVDGDLDCTFESIILEDAASVAGPVFIETIFSIDSRFLYRELVLLSSSANIKRIDKKFPIVRMERTLGLPLCENEEGMIKFIKRHVLYANKPLSMVPERKEVKQRPISRTRSCSDLTVFSASCSPPPFISKRTIRRSQSTCTESASSQPQEEEEQVTKKPSGRPKRGLKRSYSTNAASDPPSSPCLTPTNRGLKRSYSTSNITTCDVTAPPAPPSPSATPTKRVRQLTFRDSNDDNELALLHSQKATKKSSPLAQLVTNENPDFFNEHAVRIHLVDEGSSQLSLLIRAFFNAMPSKKQRFSSMWYDLHAGGVFESAGLFNQLLSSFPVPSFLRRTKLTLQQQEHQVERKQAQCSICGCDFVNPVVIHECLHMFCKWCLETYLSHKQEQCPLCQKPSKHIFSMVGQGSVANEPGGYKMPLHREYLLTVGQEEKKGGEEEMFLVQQKIEYLKGLSQTKFILVTSSKRVQESYRHSELSCFQSTNWQNFVEAPTGVLVCSLKEASEFPICKFPVQMIVNDINPQTISDLKPLILEREKLKLELETPLHILVFKSGLDRGLLLSLDHELSSFEEEMIVFGADVESGQYRTFGVMRNILLTSAKEHVIRVLCSTSDNLWWQSLGITPSDIREISVDEIEVQTFGRKWIINRHKQTVTQETKSFTMDEILQDTAHVSRFSFFFFHCT